MSSVGLPGTSAIIFHLLCTTVSLDYSLMEYRLVTGGPRALLNPEMILEMKAMLLKCQKRWAIEFQMPHRAIMSAVGSLFHETVTFCPFNPLFFFSHLLGVGHNY